MKFDLLKASLAGLIILNSFLPQLANAALINLDRDNFIDNYQLVNPTGGAIGEGLVDSYALATGHSETVGNMILDPDANIRWSSKNWSSHLPGFELGISWSNYGSDDSFTFGFTRAITAFGFDMYGTAADFEIRLFNNNTAIDTLSFNHTSGLSFMGLSSGLAFNRIEIEELVKNNSNQYYGSFVMSQLDNPTSVPEPAPLILFALAIFSLGASRLKRTG
ncbi:PEP-CTERM sorting domain-containing protein [Thalassomonas actiniarum]|uniref:PEP-CTERM sorting domain-containing protein n=1 Tax=Thalassomonas actiniarum TaxID=485447 RepID=A0AAE9YUJ0_9GAMM|nr:PEP-CTERM sorting domain-containing protein [Thalassomonas actiniarum]WDE00609.1 PEP-CTERM sorting domain-containing protein [Thalassomonas actiniarum]